MRCGRRVDGCHEKHFSECEELMIGRLVDDSCVASHEVVVGCGGGLVGEFVDFQR